MNSISYNTESSRSLVYSLVRVADPLIAVELGVHKAGSLLLIASAMKTSSTLYGFDLFEDNESDRFAEYESVSISDAGKYVVEEYEKLKREKVILGASKTERVLPHIYLLKMDAVRAADSVAFTSLLHVDVGNHESNVRNILKAWLNKVDDMIILEGGKRTDWHRKHKLNPFEQVLNETWVCKDWKHIVIPISENKYITIMTRH